MVREINMNKPGLEDLEALASFMLSTAARSGLPLSDLSLEFCDTDKREEKDPHKIYSFPALPKHTAQKLAAYLLDTLNIPLTSAEFYEHNVVVLHTDKAIEGAERKEIQRWYVKWHAHSSLIDSEIKPFIQDLLDASVEGFPELIYRGEPFLFPRVSSTLYRKYDIDDVGFLQEALSTELRHAHSYEQITDDVELQSLIQHFGGKTNLIDFSSSIWIALFFATDRPPLGEGRLLVLDPSNATEYEVFDDFHRVNAEAQDRVRNQKSIFVSPAVGYLSLDKFASIIQVPNELKGKLRSYLRAIHDIRPESMFPDIHGFIREQDDHLNFHTLQAAGNALIKSGEKEKLERALPYYDLAEIVDPRDFFSSQAQAGKAVAYMKLGRYQEALACADEVIGRLSSERHRRKNGALENAYLVKAIISHECGLSQQAAIEVEKALLYSSEDSVNREVVEKLLLTVKDDRRRRR